MSVVFGHLYVLTVPLFCTLVVGVQAGMQSVQPGLGTHRAALDPSRTSPRPPEADYLLNYDDEQDELEEEDETILTQVLYRMLAVPRCASCNDQCSSERKLCKIIDDTF